MCPQRAKTSRDAGAVDPDSDLAEAGYAPSRGGGCILDGAAAAASTTIWAEEDSHAAGDTVEDSPQQSAPRTDYLIERIKHR
jgi:hypothetical protein